MGWASWKVALLIILTLAGCASTAAGPGQSHYTPYPLDDHLDLRGGGGDRGGSGM